MRTIKASKFLDDATPPVVRRGNRNEIFVPLNGFGQLRGRGSALAVNFRIFGAKISIRKL